MVVEKIMEWFLNAISFVHSTFDENAAFHCFMFDFFACLFLYLRLTKHEKEIEEAKIPEGYEPSKSFFNIPYKLKLLHLFSFFLLSHVIFNIVMKLRLDDWTWFLTVISWAVFINSYYWFSLDVMRFCYSSNIAFTNFLFSLYLFHILCLSGISYCIAVGFIYIIIIAVENISFYREFKKFEAWRTRPRTSTKKQD